MVAGSRASNARLSTCGISEIWLTLRIENGGKGNWWERCRSLLYQKEKGLRSKDWRDL
jgi:hypothetical protein